MTNGRGTRGQGDRERLTRHRNGVFVGVWSAIGDVMPAGCRRSVGTVPLSALRWAEGLSLLGAWDLMR
jgi:hypothetical protein